ncbi:MAG: aldehyde dehydrogenase family protein [Deltaproteobacteria bacterium]|nr:aldehyde dehydrogenase family protein [Deltaproteobacteria bacterium]
MKAQPFYLGGEWKESQEVIEIKNPFNGKIVSKVCQAQSQDILFAVQTAHNIFPKLKSLSSFEKACILKNIVKGLLEEKETLAKSITQEMGKPLKESLNEVLRALNTFEIAAEEVTRFGGEWIPLDTTPTSLDRVGLSKRFPVGVVCGITPFNYPLNLASHKIAPALAVGNPLILKPPLQCPTSSLLLAKIIENSGLPKEAFSVLPCSNELAEALAFHQNIKLISFTGSAHVGWYLKQKAQKQKVILELGGVANLVVDEDADLNDVVKRCLMGAFTNAGQSCISTQRIYVHHRIYKKFLELFIPQVQKLKMGNPLNLKTDLGPLVTQKAAERVEEWVNEAVKKGAKLLCGGKRKKTFYEPTVLTGVKENMKISCEEIFGPVCFVNSFTHFDDVLKTVNNTPFGLQAGLYTQDIQKIWKAYEVLDVGGLVVGDTPTFRLDHMPYGGIKDSGVGREGLKYAMEEMTEPKLLVLRKQ